MSYNNMLIEKTLAIDYVGRFIYRKYLRTDTSTYDASLAVNLKTLVSDITAFQNYILKNELPTNMNVTERQLYEKYPKFVIDCKNVFNRVFVDWTERIDRLSHYGKPE